MFHVCFIIIIKLLSDSAIRPEKITRECWKAPEGVFGEE